ncbi:DUF432 domain-containing protein [candidate division KSB1 bacterium]|nr:DUF432 domain-containing protein [candidate division KSB1 bacterium]
MDCDDCNCSCDGAFLQTQKMVIGEKMFGPYNIPFRIECNDILIEAINEDDITIYRRKFGNDTIEKKLLATNRKIIISPIKPINRPKKLTPHLLIEFETPLFTEPRSNKKIYLKFPVEIGLFIMGGKSFELLDVFTIMNQKYTLYGDPINGVLCKYWKSPVENNRPEIDLLTHGIMELSITNKSSTWLEVSKVVFNSYGMKMYYNQQFICLKAEMKIYTELSAETDFIDSALEKKMTKSVELYNAKKLQLTTTKFVMRDGI